MFRAGRFTKAYKAFAGRAVLVAEDEKILEEVLTEALAPAFERFDWTDNGVDALARVVKHDYDLIILDIRMPRMDGMEVYRYLSVFRPKLLERVIFITGELHDPEVRDFLDASGARVLAKPFLIKELIKAMAATCAPALESLSVRDAAPENKKRMN